MPKNKPKLREETKPYGSINAVKTTTVGTSGVDISGNRFFEEYLDKLLSEDGPKEWDKMRRSDDQVSMLLRLVMNPIISARWFIAPADESDQAQEIADFIKFLLFENMGTEQYPKSFNKLKREILTMVTFGYSLFEETDKVVIDSPNHGSYVGIKGIDWRSPKTITEWDISKSGELLGIWQDDNSDLSTERVYIDGKFILHFCSEMEGANYEGISLLRPIYGNYIRKDFLNKMKMIGTERASVGVPLGTIPPGQVKSDAAEEFKDALSRFVLHERGYMVVPEGYKVESFKIEFKASEIQELIRAENVGMTKSFLANFMELAVEGGSGSYALGTDLSDIFLSGIQVYANAAREPFNMKLIPRLVKLNFGPQEKYPELKIEGINDKAGKEFAEVIQILKGAGLIQSSDKLKEAIHKRLNLPDYDKELKEEEEPEEDKEEEPEEKKEEKSELSESIFSLAETNISKKITQTGEAMTAVMAASMSQRGNKLVDQMLDIWRNAPKSKRREKVNRLTVPDKNEYKRKVSEALADVYVKATAGVKRELDEDGLKLAEEGEIKNLPSESKAAGASQADLIVESQDADLRKNLFFSFTSKADILPTEEQMNANLLNVVQKYVNGASMRVAGPNAVANAVNIARNAVYQKKETLDKIESFIFTNPSPEAAICKELAGRVFTKQEYVVSDKLPPLHHNCNSWIKAQISGRKGNKPVSPAGLSIQGTDKQIEQIEKSITL